MNDDGTVAESSKKEIEQDLSSKDILVAGSDQIFNPELTGGLSDVYTLNFKKDNVDKIIYGASVGNDELLEANKEEIIETWKNFKGEPQDLELPHAPKQFLHYFVEDNMPQTKLNRNLEGGMAVSIGRLREDSQYDYKFVCLSHNTLRGAAGGAVLIAELLYRQGYLA